MTRANVFHHPLFIIPTVLLAGLATWLLSQAISATPIIPEASANWQNGKLDKPIELKQEVDGIVVIFTMSPGANDCHMHGEIKMPGKPTMSLKESRKSPCNHDMGQAFLLKLEEEIERFPPELRQKLMRLIEFISDDFGI